MPARRNVPLTIADALVSAYVSGGRIVDIGKPYGYDYKTVRRVLAERGVPIRNVGSQRRRPLQADLDEVLGWVRGGESCNQIAKRLGTYPNKVAGFLRSHGHEPPDGRYRRGKANPLTKAGRWIGKEGYATVILEPGEYHLKGARNGNSMLEHRLVMARHLGRALYPHENVHHINGDRADNRLENLELWEKGQPPGQRVGQAMPRKHCPTCSCC